MANTKNAMASDVALQLVSSLRCLHEAVSATDSVQRLAAMNCPKVLHDCIAAANDLKNLAFQLETMCELESTAVAANVKYRNDNAKLLAENSALRDRNAALESAHSDMCDASRSVLAIENR